MAGRALPQNTPLEVFAPEQSTLDFVARALSGVGIKKAAMMTIAKWSEKRDLLLDSPSLRAVLIVPENRNLRRLFELAHAARRRDVPVLIWSAQSSTREAGVTNEWLLEQVLLQLGAAINGNLTVCAEAIKILVAIPKTVVPTSTIRIARSPGGLMKCVARAFAQNGVRLQKSGSSIWTIQFQAASSPSLAYENRTLLQLNDPETTARAFAMAGQARRPFDAAPHQKIKTINVDPSQVDTIVKPPARLLSETTSKRLLALYGLLMPDEKLCRTPTEATRFAAARKRPVVLKLICPELEQKELAGLVRRNLTSASTIRQAFHSLNSAAQSLDIKPSLGVLVSDQIRSGSRIWLKFAEHRDLGRLILVGDGDRLSDTPQASLRIPAGLADARLALRRLNRSLPDTDVDKLARSIVRFSAFIEKLGPRIDRAEIHPLVAKAPYEDALVLDALVGIAGTKANKKRQPLGAA